MKMGYEYIVIILQSNPLSCKPIDFSILACDSKSFKIVIIENASIQYSTVANCYMIFRNYNRITMYSKVLRANRAIYSIRIYLNTTKCTEVDISIFPLLYCISSLLFKFLTYKILGYIVLKRTLPLSISEYHKCSLQNTLHTVYSMNIIINQYFSDSLHFKCFHCWHSLGNFIIIAPNVVKYTLY
ncbi:hypothetical protein BDA99DRAFT_542419 [Phascolomyces articulosus]|uniref:Uncharacterized protein n=1 Tax=Phascolomyces articulosus TaxID=60185 RepID=A0AAD5JPT5_9FUNG|nr:hypothetical protein BDA99DRAFT_542419 [Phascolomyces articulosus]